MNNEQETFYDSLENYYRAYKPKEIIFFGDDIDFNLDNTVLRSGVSEFFFHDKTATQIVNVKKLFNCFWIG